MNSGKYNYNSRNKINTLSFVVNSNCVLMIKTMISKHYKDRTCEGNEAKQLRR